MKFERLVVQGVRKLAERYEIDGLGPGLTVISGDNEEGKSTVLAAIKAAFFLRHTAGGQVRAQLAPHGGATVPHVEVVFSLDGRTFHLQKSFKRGGIRLVTPEGTLEGEAAEHRLAELAGIDLPDRGQAKPEQTGLPGLFWIDQATTFDGFEPGRVGQEQLAGAITQEVEAVASSDLARSLLAKAREERNVYWQPARGQPRGSLLDWQQRVADLTQKHEVLDRDWKAIEGGLARLDGLHQERRRLVAADPLGEARQRCEALRARKAEIESRQRQAAIECERLKAAKSGLEISARKRSARTELATELEAREAERQGHDQELAELRDQLTELAGDLDATAGKLAEAGQDIEKRRQRLDRLRRLRQAAIAAVRVHALEEAQSRLQRLLEIRTRADQEIVANPFDDKAIDELNRANSVLRDAKIALRSAATRLTFAPREGAGVSVAGQPLDFSQPVEISREMTFDLADFGRLKVEPGGKETAALRRGVDDATVGFADQLRRLGVESLEDALQRAAERAVALSDHRDASTRLAELLDGHGAADIEAFHRLVDWARAEMDAPEPGGEEGEVTDESIRLAEEEVSVLESSLAGQRQTVEVLEKKRSELRERLARREAIGTERTKQAARLAARLEQERAEQDDEALAAALQGAQEGVRELTLRCSVIEGEVEQSDPDGVAQALAQAERRVEQLNAERQKLDRDIADLQLELRIKGGEGLGEQRAEALGLLQQATSEFRRIELHAMAWRLLHDELAAADRARRDRLVTPIVTRVAPYLTRLFNTGEPLGLDADKLSLAHLQRDGVSEAFDQLSVGTREQLAVLVRLACAQLVAEKTGESPPVILDDALVYADERRFEIMKTILEQAAETIQILVLTCRPRDYFGLDARFIRLEDCRTAATGN